MGEYFQGTESTIILLWQAALPLCRAAPHRLPPALEIVYLGAFSTVGWGHYLALLTVATDLPACDTVPPLDGTMMLVRQEGAFSLHQARWREWDRENGAGHLRLLDHKYHQA